MKILWVENHAKFAQYTIRQFLNGYAVTVVPSLADARSVLAVASFDMVFVDFDLDDGKGVELVQALSLQPERPPIIAASAHEEGNSALLAAGADAVCGKLEFSRIAEVIAKWAID